MKTNILGFRPGPTQIELYKHKRWLEAENFGFKTKMGLLSCSENKDANQHRSYCEDGLRLCFRTCKMLVFLVMRLKSFKKINNYITQSV